MKCVWEQLESSYPAAGMGKLLVFLPFPILVLQNCRILEYPGPGGTHRDQGAQLLLPSRGYPAVEFPGCAELLLQEVLPSPSG